MALEDKMQIFTTALREKRSIEETIVDLEAELSRRRRELRDAEVKLGALRDELLKEAPELVPPDLA